MKWDQDYVKHAAFHNKIVAGFNIFGYEDAQAVIKAAERSHSPVLLMLNRDARRILDIQHWAALLKSLANASSVPVAIHLDHCSEPEQVERAIHLGFTSVMYDGSKLPVEQNIEISAKLKKIAQQHDVWLETELGTVPYNDLGESVIELTDPNESNRMEQMANVDWLAISVGNIHRLTTQKVSISFEVLQQIEHSCTIPLVIHGSSGIFQTDLLRLKKTRVGKMNFGTVLRQAFGSSLRKQINQNPGEFDRLRLMEKPTKCVEDKAYEILKMLWWEE